MKTSIGLSMLFCSALFIFSCNDSTPDSSQANSGEPAATRDSSEMNNPNHQPADNTAQDTANKLPAAGNIDPAPINDNATADFMKEAAGGGMMEVTLGQTAQQNAENARVKAFGAMMVADHTKANNELKAIAGAKNFPLPAALPEKHQHHVDNLSKKQGRSFDKAYVDMMVDDHQKDIKAFEKASKSGADSTVRAFAARTLPVLRKHLDSIQAISRGL
jgi:putative membrane protein